MFSERDKFYAKKRGEPLDEEGQPHDLTAREILMAMQEDVRAIAKNTGLLATLAILSVLASLLLAFCGPLL